MNELYYTPKLEDLYVGYEYEAFLYNPQGIQEWATFRLVKEAFPLCEELINKGHLRTPFLTKEQIETEGWEFTGRGVSLWFKHKEDIILMWHGHHLNKLEIMFSPHDQVLHINATFIGGEEMRFFEGICPSINEFRKIIKLCSINKDLENLY